MKLIVTFEGDVVNRVAGLPVVGDVIVTDVTLSVNFAWAVQPDRFPTAVAMNAIPMSPESTWNASKLKRPVPSAVIAMVISGSLLFSWIVMFSVSFGLQPSPIILTT